ncbi:MAG TPA: hypothetical protein VMT46_17370 [Anaerolineaceae bacterium]|nr:hypothetical protein [Anaerolineaceae bacterium]
MKKKPPTNRRSSAALLAALMIVINGCRPLAPVSPLATLEPVRVQYTPALEKGFLAQLQACSGQSSGIGLMVKKTPAQSLELSRFDLTVRIEVPPGTRDFAADLGKLEIRVISHPGLSLTSLTLADLAAIYSGKMQEWPGGASLPVQAWTYLPGDDLRIAFEGLVLNGETPVKAVYQAPDPAAMIQAVSQTPGAIGFIPSDWMSAKVHTVNLDRSLSVPVVGLASAEPQGAARRLLACLQERNW